MSKNLGWRGAIIGITILLALLYLTPTLTTLTSGELPQWWSKVLLPKEEIHLGLDLQGGMHLVYEVDVLKAVENDLDRSVEDMKDDLRREKIRYRELRRDNTKGIDVTIMREMDKESFIKMAKSRYPEYEIREVGIKEGGPAFEMILKAASKKETMEKALEQVHETIMNRVDEFGVAEPDIRPLDNYRLQIQLPGAKDPERIKALIKTTAQLEFRLVDDENLDAALKGNIPPGEELLYKKDSKSRLLVMKRSSLTGEYLNDARVTIDQMYNEPQVSLSLNKKGARIFERVTADNINKRLAIVLDNVIYMAPNIDERIPGGQARIRGGFTMEKARDLAIVLRAGALPAPLKIMEERTVGPSLGRDSIERGFKSMIIGLILVILFMIIYYGFSGIIADFALLLNILFIMAGLAALSATLTLPGIAGIILTIGMAVDANVLIFERIREELRLGKTIRTAIESGYEKAFVTILDANVTTFIAALVLFQFGTGPVKGFAVTLSIGIVASFFTAVFITRVVFDFLFIRMNWKKISI